MRKTASIRQIHSVERTNGKNKTKRKTVYICRCYATLSTRRLCGLRESLTHVHVTNALLLNETQRGDGKRVFGKRQICPFVSLAHSSTVESNRAKLPLKKCCEQRLSGVNVSQQHIGKTALHFEREWSDVHMCVCTLCVGVIAQVSRKSDPHQMMAKAFSTLTQRHSTNTVRSLLSLSLVAGLSMCA